MGKCTQTSIAVVPISSSLHFTITTHVAGICILAVIYSLYMLYRRKRATLQQYLICVYMYYIQKNKDLYLVYPHNLSISNTGFICMHNVKEYMHV